MSSLSLDHSMNIFELPELVTNILLNLQTEERAQSRLINKTFNQVYLIEEQDEFIKLWKRYKDGHLFGYNEKTITEEELLDLQQEFDIPSLQYHLKIWLTKCSNGRFEPSKTLLCISNTADWETNLYNVPWLHDYIDTLKIYLDEELLRNLICVDKSRDGFHFMDKRNGQFYYYKDERSWKKIGHIKKWLESIPYDILGSLSKFNGYSFIDSLDEYLELKNDNKIEKIIELFRTEMHLYPYLTNELKRNEEILKILTNNNYENQNGFTVELPASIPIEMRQDKDMVMKYFKIADFSIYLPSKLRYDKEFIIKLLEEHGTLNFSFTSIPKEFLTDVRILKLLKNTFLEISGDGWVVPNLELDTIEKVMIFRDYPSLYPYISDNLLEDKELSREILRQIYGNEFNEQDQLVALKQLSEGNEDVDLKNNPLILNLADSSFRNNRELFHKLPNGALLFLGESLKKDLDLLAQANMATLRKLNLSDFTKEEFLLLCKKIQERTEGHLGFLFWEFFKAIKNQIPSEFLNDREFVLETYRLSSSKFLIGKELSDDVELWREISQIDGYLDCFAPYEIKNDRKLLLGLEFLNVQNCSDELLLDVDFLIERNIQSEYAYLSKEMRSNKKLLMHIVGSGSIIVLNFASPSLLNDPDVIKLMSEYQSQ